ncbi:HAD family hydrolase [Actinoplanes sp. NPDC000266]
MTIRAVVTDLDGTAVPTGDVITPVTLTAVSRLTVPLIAVTARTPAGVRRLGRFADRLALAVSNGGALGWNPATGATLWEEVIATEELRSLIDFARALPGVGMSVFGVDAWKMTPSYLRLRGHTPREPWRSVSLDALADRPAYGAVFRHATLTSDEMVTRLAEAGFTTRLNVTYSADHLVDIGPLGVDKASGTRRALGLLGVHPSDAVAFGDMPNDLAMFACCGQSVAMANGHPAVRAAATFTTASAADDGFARALEKLGLSTDE